MNISDAFVVAVLATIGLLFLLAPKRDAVGDKSVGFKIMWAGAYFFWCAILGMVTGVLWYGIVWLIIGLDKFFLFLGGLIF